MANGYERFIDLACEMTGEKSPSEVRQEEFGIIVAQALAENTWQPKISMGCIPPLRGELMYAMIFDDIGFCDGEE